MKCWMIIKQFTINGANHPLSLTKGSSVTSHQLRTRGPRWCKDFLGCEESSLNFPSIQHSPSQSFPTGSILSLLSKTYGHNIDHPKDTDACLLASAHFSFILKHFTKSKIYYNLFLYVPIQKVWLKHLSDCRYQGVSAKCSGFAES